MVAHLICGHCHKDFPAAESHCPHCGRAHPQSARRAVDPGECPETLDAPSSSRHAADVGTRTPYSIVRAAQAGDAEAWEKLIDLFGPLVLVWCTKSRLGLAANEAEEVAADVLASVSQGILEWQRDDRRNSFRRWLRTIVKHKLIDYCRKKQQQPAATGGSANQRWLQSLPDPETLEDDDLGSVSEERRQLYLRAVKLIQDRFPAYYFTIFWRVVVENRPREEMAEIFGVQLGTIHKIISRIKHAVREVFGEVLDMGGGEGETNT